jgi:hypothetical protein
MAIDAYSINAYWLLVFIFLMLIGAYFINAY